jgi:hypothetical protein
MRVLVPVLALALVACTGDTPDEPLGAAAVIADETGDELLDRLQAIPGLTVVAELPVPASYPAGTRFFRLELTQRSNHFIPWSTPFQQRASLLVRDLEGPTILFTTGYDLPQVPFRSELTALLGANQLGIEHRFFEGSRPEPANWNNLTILQAAIDHHRVVDAMKPLLGGRWISTGASKGGMTSMYHRRFFPNDVYATVAYVAPNDVIDSHDRYIEHIDNAGTDPECRAALERVQRVALEHRDELVPLMIARGVEQGYSFGHTLTADQAFEYLVLETPFTFWQVAGQQFCPFIPADGAPAEEVFEFLDAFVGLSYFSDEFNDFYAPYFFAAATQINYPTVKTRHVRELLRFLPEYAPRHIVPPEIDVPRHQPLAMLDIDIWVRLAGNRLMFIYGEVDPWGAEQFELGIGTRDSVKYIQPAGTHGARISRLPAADRVAAEATIYRWAGVPAPEAAKRGTRAEDDEDALRSIRRPL